MKHNENSPPVKIEPELKQSDDSSRSEKNKNDHSRDERKKKKRNSHDEDFTQDIIESSQSCVIPIKKIRLDNRDSEISNVILVKQDETSRKKGVGNKSRVSHTLSTSDEDEESHSSETKGVKRFISSSTSNKTSDNYRFESRGSDEEFSQDEKQRFEFVGVMKSENMPADTASNCNLPNVSVEHIKTEPDVIGKYRKHEAEEKVGKKKAHTLLTMIHDIRSSSDSDNEIEKIGDSSDKSGDKVNSTKSTKSRVSETFKEKAGDEASSEQPVEDPSPKHWKFDLETEARDVEEMISAVEEAEQVPDESMQKLLNLRVKLKHTVPPQHQIETCAGSRGPTQKQKEMFEKFGPIKYGKFAPEEDAIIVKNWKSFCKLHDWDSRNVQPFLYMRHRNVGSVTKFSERQKFVQFLANGLPWRLLYSVYWRFRNLYRPHIQTRYTDDEDRLIIAHMENSSAIDEKNVRRFSELAKILNRTRASVWKRYRLLNKRRNPYKKLEWNLHLVKKFIKNLMKLTLSNDVCQLKDLDIPLVVWKKLSEKLKIDNKELKQFWLGKLHMQLFCPEPLYMNDIKIKLIEYFCATEITESWEIEWSNVAKHFDGTTSTFLAGIFGHLIHDKRYEGMEFSQIIGHLYEVKKPELQKRRNDKCLPRVVFKDGNVKLLDVKADNRSKRKTVE